MAVPVYLFLVTYLAMLAYGVVQLVLEGPGPAGVGAAAEP